MPLQRNLGAGLHHQALDLEALALVQALEISPRTVYAAVCEMFIPVACLQMLHSELHILGEILVRYEYRVVRLDDHEVLYTDCRDQSALGPHVAASCSIEIDIAAHGVAVRILRLQLPECAP